MIKPPKLDKFFKGLFLVAALYDFILGLIFLFFYKEIYQFFNIAPLAYPAYLQMALAFVVAMGIGYYFVYRNLYRNVDLVKLGIAYKATYSGLATYFYYAGLAHVLFLWFAIFDATFLLLFIWFLVYIRKDGRYLKWK